MVDDTPSVARMLQWLHAQDARLDEAKVPAANRIYLVHNNHAVNTLGDVFRDVEAARSAIRFVNACPSAELGDDPLISFAYDARMPAAHMEHLMRVVTGWSMMKPSSGFPTYAKAAFAAIERSRSGAPPDIGHPVAYKTAPSIPGLALPVTPSAARGSQHTT
jgi:hypothetical protein